MTELAQKISQLQQQVVNNASVWQRLQDNLSRMSNEQLAFINKDPDCVAKKTAMNSVFIEWLFEQYKNDFVQVSQFNSLANEYVDCIITKADDFSKRQANLVQDNENLRKELEELRKFKQEHDKSSEVLI